MHLLSYALEINNGKRIHYYSNPDWQEIFIKEKLINHCPLLKFGRESSTSILDWNMLFSSLNKKQRRVMDARRAMNIGNGIGAKQSIYNFLEMVTFASDCENYVMDFRGYLDPSKVNFNLNNSCN